MPSNCRAPVRGEGKEAHTQQGWPGLSTRVNASTYHKLRVVTEPQRRVGSADLQGPVPDTNDNFNFNWGLLGTHIAGTERFFFFLAPLLPGLKGNPQGKPSLLRCPHFQKLHDSCCLSHELPRLFCGKDGNQKTQRIFFLGRGVTLAYFLLDAFENRFEG